MIDIDCLYFKQTECINYQIRISDVTIWQDIRRYPIFVLLKHNTDVAFVLLVQNAPEVTPSSPVMF